MSAIPSLSNDQAAPSAAPSFSSSAAGPSRSTSSLPSSNAAPTLKPTTSDDQDSIPSTASSAAPSAASASTTTTTSTGTSMTSYRSDASLNSTGTSGMSSTGSGGSVAPHLDSFPLPAHRDTAAIRRSMDQGAIAEGVVAFEQDHHHSASPQAFPLTSSPQLPLSRTFAPRPARSRETSHESRASESTLESYGTHSQEGSASSSVGGGGGRHSPYTTATSLPAAGHAVYHAYPSRQRERPSGAAAAAAATPAPSHPPNAWASRSSASSLSLAGRNRSSSVGSGSEVRSSPSESSPRTSSLLSSSSGVAEPVSSSSEADSILRRPRAATWKASVPSNLQYDDSDDSAMVSVTAFSASSLPGGRTPRSSMYGAFEPLASATQVSGAGTSSSSGTAASVRGLSGPRPPSPNQRRRIFSRKGSILGGSKESLSAGSTSVPSHPEAGGGAARNFMRRVGSRSFFGSNSRDKEGLALQEAMRSTDSLASAAGSVRTESSATSGSQPRSSELLARTKTLPKWARRKISLRSGDGSQAAAAAAAAAAATVARANSRLDKRQSTSSSSTTAGSDLLGRDEGAPLPSASASCGVDAGATTPVGTVSSATGAAGSLGDRTVAAGTSAGETNDGIPRRLSGWIFNMLGSEGSQVDLSRNPTLSTSPEATGNNAAWPRHADPSATGTRQGTGGSVATTPGGNAPLPASASSASASSAQNHQRPKTSGGGGLLQSLSSSARARAMAAAGAVAGAGGGGGGGLDRALRYFLDEGAAGTTEEEGIWLLGVWHGPEQIKPISPESRPSQLSPPSSPQISAKGPTIAISQPSPEPPRRMPFPSSSPTSSPRAARSSEDFARRRARETSPALSDTTSAESVGLQSAGGDSLPSSRQASEPPRTPSPTEAMMPSGTGTPSDAVVVRNPPTPHTEASSSASNASKASVRRTGSNTSHASPSTTPSSAPSGISLPSFQSDFGSKVWCTYRSHFVPIARDGTISEQAETAAMRAAQVQTALNVPSTPGTPMTDRTSNVSTPVTASASVSTPGGPGRTGWLGRRLADGSTGDLLNTSANPQLTASPTLSGSLGAAMGLSSTSPPPSGGGLGEKMGIPNLWSRATAAAQAAGLTGRSGLTTDAGWGCMLRTGQSVLANALIHAHLGRDWRIGGPPAPSSAFGDSGGRGARDDDEEKKEWRRARRRYALYVRMLSWFMDEPSRACPFGVHRMAREGKRLGKEVGEWFGPSTAAGAIKSLVDAFPEAGMGVCLASDGVVFLSQVRDAAAVATEPAASTSNPKVGGRNASGGKVWRRPVLILVGVRLGLEGVNPVYHDSIKRTFSFPQSVGIAGGRPSSSYYFVGYQSNSLFYLDPHHVRPTIPFRHPPPHVVDGSRRLVLPRPDLHEADTDADTDADGDSTSEAEEWWSHAYSPSELATFHCEKPRRMPIRSLDPSMLLGFLVRDEASLQDLSDRVKQLSKAIFAIQDAPPKWMMMDDEAEGDGMDGGEGGEEDPALESFSESSVDGFDDDGASDEEEEGVTSKMERRCQRQLEGSESVTELDGAATPNLGASATLEAGAAFAAASSSRLEGGLGSLGLGGMRRPQVQLEDGALRPRIEAREVSDASQRTERPPAPPRLASASTKGAQDGPRTSDTGDESFASVNFSDVSGSAVGMGEENLISPPLSPSLDDEASESDTAWERVERERSDASPCSTSWPTTTPASGAPTAEVQGGSQRRSQDAEERLSPPSSPQQPSSFSSSSSRPTHSHPSRRSRKEGARPQPPAASFSSGGANAGGGGLLSFPSLGSSPSKERSASHSFIDSQASVPTSNQTSLFPQGPTGRKMDGQQQPSSLNASPSMGLLGLGESGSALVDDAVALEGGKEVAGRGETRRRRKKSA